MTPGERFRGWIESLSEVWKERLRGWMISWAVGGIRDALEDMTPEQKAALDAVSKRVIDNPDIPADLRKLLEEAGKKGNPWLKFLQIFFGGIYLLDIILRQIVPENSYYGYKQARAFANYRLDPITLTRIWLRDKVFYEEYFNDLRDQGWSEERIAIAKELANIIPPLADMVRFADFGSFDPEIIEKWREFYDAPSWISEPFALLGVTGEWANKYWFSHWVQPGRYELGELHRRELIDDEGVKLAYRTMGYSPYWQDLLLDLVKEIPTRVDVRRWWDMRTIDEAELRKIYHKRGYYGKDLDNYVLWTKVYVAFPDLIARWKNGWITIDEVKSELTGYGMPADRLDELIETKIKAAQPERTAAERDLTKTDIVMGVKKGTITRGEGIELLMDLGYDADEAEFVLDVRIAVEAGSPESFEEFKDLTSKWRKSSGMEAGPEVEEIKQAAAEVVKLTRDIEILKTRVKEEEAKLVGDNNLPAEVTAKRDELRVSLHRAESKLAAARSHYDALVAEWRYKGG